MNGDPKTRHDPADQRPQRQLMAATAAATGQGNPPFPPKVGGRLIAIGSIAPPKRASSRHSSETRSLRDRTVLFGVIGALAFAALYFVYWLITLLKLGSASLMLFTAINTIGFLSFLALLQALCWSAALGLVVGAGIALFRDYILGRGNTRHLG